MKTNTQRYIPLVHADKCVSIVAVSVRKKCVVVAHGSSNPRIVLYDLNSLRWIKTLVIPFETTCEEFIQMSFNCDHNYIVALTGSPDYFMYYYDWRSGRIESQLKMAVNPRDAVVVFVGTGLFRLFSMSDHVWRQYGFQRAQAYPLISCCWLSEDRILAGSADGRILIVQSGELNAVYNFEDLPLDLCVVSQRKHEIRKPLNRGFSRQISDKQLRETGKNAKRINRCASSKIGFFLSSEPAVVTFFEKTNANNYKRKKTYRIPINGDESDEAYVVNHMTVTVDQTALFCTVIGRVQIYYVTLNETFDEEVDFKLFGQSLHSGPLQDISSNCLWKPLFMTCSERDKTVKIWNYKTKLLALDQTFAENVICLSMHPTGLYALLAFSSRLEFVLVLSGCLKTHREIPLGNCSHVAFSNRGHLFAAESQHDIYVYCAIKFHRLSVFKGNYKDVTSMLWSSTDSILHTCAVNGVYYEWNVEEKTRIADVASKVAYNGLVVYNINCALCVTQNGVIHDIRNNEVCDEITLKDGRATGFYAIAYSKKKSAVFLGGKNGAIFALKYPKGEKVEFDVFFAQNKNITKLHLIGEESYLMSICEQGTICLWALNDDNADDNNNNYFGSDLPNFDEILVNEGDLFRMSLNLEQARKRVEECCEEYEFHIRKMAEKHRDELKDLEEKKSEDASVLEEKISFLRETYEKREEALKLQMKEMEIKHEKIIEVLTEEFSAKMAAEYEKTAVNGICKK